MQTINLLTKQKERIERSIEEKRDELEDLEIAIKLLEHSLAEIEKLIEEEKKEDNFNLFNLIRHFIDNHTKDVSWATIEAAEKFIRSEVISRIGGKNILRQQMRQFGYPIDF
jgi:ATP-dependent protease HslVU (ClpYQ) ATPase subunit